MKDQNHDNVIDAKDKVILGQQLPKWTGSITNTFTYKTGIWLSMYIPSRCPVKQYICFFRFMAYDGNYNQAKVDYWTETNPNK